MTSVAIVLLPHQDLSATQTVPCTCPSRRAPTSGLMTIQLRVYVWHKPSRHWLCTDKQPPELSPSGSPAPLRDKRSLASRGLHDGPPRRLRIRALANVVCPAASGREGKHGL